MSILLLLAEVEKVDAREYWKSVIVCGLFVLAAILAVIWWLRR